MGFDNGEVFILAGRAPFSSTAINTVTTQTKIIVDLAFNVGNTRMVVCYSDSSRFYMVSNYAVGGYTTTNHDYT